MCSLNPVPSQWGVVLHRLPPGHCVWVGGGGEGCQGMGGGGGLGWEVPG